MQRGSNQHDFDERPWTDREMLYKEYTLNCKSLEEIAEDYPITKHTIHNWIKEYNLKRIYEHKEWLEKNYFDKDKSATEIGDEIGVSQQTISKSIREKELVDVEREKCPDCGKEMIDLSKHWEGSDCTYPKLSQEQIEILTGILMGDGNCQRYGGRTPSFIIPMTNKTYLRYIEKKFPIYSNGIRLYSDSEYNAERDKKSGFNKDAKAENYLNMFCLNLKASPEFEDFSSWYSNGGKVFPENIDITPRIFKHWFCCDGSSTEANGQKYVSIACWNESENVGKLKKLFEDSKIPMPDDFYVNEECLEIRWNKEKSNKIYEMIEPVPGFEYKWP